MHQHEALVRRAWAACDRGDEKAFRRLPRARLATTATHTGKCFDLEPTGKTLRSHEISIHRIAGGRIAETFQETATAGFYMQLTGRPSPQPTDNFA